MINFLKTQRPYFIAFAIFTASRMLMLCAVLFATGDPHRSGSDPFELGSSWYFRLFRWDSNWYFSVLQTGYAHSAEAFGANNAAFYPLYPLFAKVLVFIGASPPQALLLVANVAAASSSILLFKLARNQTDTETGYLTVAFFGFFPTSVFLFAPYSEALTLLFCLGCFQLLRKNNIFSAAMLAGLATATRSTGLVLLPVVLTASYIHMLPQKLALRLRHFILSGLLATSGLLAFIIYLWWATGEPFRFVTAQSMWNGNAGLPQRFLTALSLKPLWTIKTGWFYFVIPFGLLVYSWRELPRLQIIFALGVLLLPYFTLSGGPNQFSSMPRFALLAFPVYIASAIVTRRHPWLSATILALSGAYLFANTVLFSRWYWVG